MIVVEILVWGLVAGLVSTAAMAVLYANPWVARVQSHHRRTVDTGQSAPPAPRRFAAHFLGTQLEAYIMTIGYAWLHPLLPMNGLLGAMALAVFFTALRVCAPVWALWMQGNCSSGYLAVEVAGGLLGSVVTVLSLYVLM
ncbi:hypothetical protein ABZV91_15700 [Nocardia sp. NPDC004568]|uniref:hypothetical protein n=1 Tax=Nocardia sp. NPDC004568 TaxID=3154551 RepID=UPI0033BD9A0C